MQKLSTLFALSILGCACGTDGSATSDSDSGTTGIVIPQTTSTGMESSTTDDIRLDIPAQPDVPDADTEDGCLDVTLSVEPVIPTLTLLIDQSGSMDAGFQGSTRWEATYDTLMDPVDGVVYSLEDRIRFGLVLYTNDEESNMCPDLTEVPPALNNAAAIDAIYGPAIALDETPTGESLDIVAADLAALPFPDPKGIVLATDGEPDTCAEPNPQNGQPESIAAAQNAWNLGIQTYVISVGAQVSEAHLQEMANAGAGKDPADLVDPEPYYQALNPADLVSAFQQIIADFTTCEFTLSGEIIGDPCEGEVFLDGELIECGVDWDATNPTTVELIGGACELLKDGEEHTIEAVFPCEAVFIP